MQLNLYIVFVIFIIKLIGCFALCFLGHILAILRNLILSNLIIRYQLINLTGVNLKENSISLTDKQY